ncbi:hypothetical protein KILIM_019_00160 [Kineosphaera limosa NBRC 100340]|uniref:Uncharacterized protein n=1 Tax=Kineosphaera limosa NBRC 100340 TaxID=1184609 RepID=K6X985_9MICO|nr:hypothetical protein KILIM_019_00160 [Kineosphaera limosa NBRC 100340]
MLRDARTVKHVSDTVLVEALAPYARRYGAPPGDGEALLSRLLQESGVPTSVSRAVALAEPGYPVRQPLTDWPASTRKAVR